MNSEYSSREVLLMKKEAYTKIQERMIGCVAGFEGVIVPGKNIKAQTEIDFI